MGLEAQTQELPHGHNWLTRPLDKKTGQRIRGQQFTQMCADAPLVWNSFAPQPEERSRFCIPLPAEACRVGPTILGLRSHGPAQSRHW